MGITQLDNIKVYLLPKNLRDRINKTKIYYLNRTIQCIKCVIIIIIMHIIIIIKIIAISLIIIKNKIIKKLHHFTLWYLDF